MLSGESTGSLTLAKATAAGESGTLSAALASVFAGAGFGEQPVIRPAATRAIIEARIMSPSVGGPLADRSYSGGHSDPAFNVGPARRLSRIGVGEGTTVKQRPSLRAVLTLSSKRGGQAERLWLRLVR